MKALVFTNKQSKFDVSLQKLTKQMKRRGISMSIIAMDGRSGTAQAQLYEVYVAPAIILTRDDGAPVASWRNSLPQIDDVSYQMGMI